MKFTNPKLYLPPIKHGGRRIMCWRYFSASGPGEQVTVQGILDKKCYLDILIINIKNKGHSSHVWVSYEMMWNMMQIVIKYFEDSRNKVLAYPSQNPDVKCIENLWALMKESFEFQRLRNYCDGKMEHSTRLELLRNYQKLREKLRTKITQLIIQARELTVFFWCERFLLLYKILLQS